MGSEVVLVAQAGVLFPLLAATTRTTLQIEYRVVQLQDAILEIVEGADAGHIVGRKAAQQGLQGVLAQTLAPHLDGGDVAF